MQFNSFGAIVSRWSFDPILVTKIFRFVSYSFAPDNIWRGGGGGAGGETKRYSQTFFNIKKLHGFFLNQLVSKTL
jgi:hypothetical protein